MADSRILCEVCEKGKFVINNCIKRGHEINTEKLEKLLIIMQGEMLKKYKEPFFLQPIIVTNKEVMIPKLRKEFSMYSGAIKEEFTEYYHLTELEKEIIDIVINEYSDMNLLNLRQKMELTILDNMFNDSLEKFNFVSNEMIKNVFTRTEAFNQNFEKSENQKQKSLAIK